MVLKGVPGERYSFKRGNGREIIILNASQGNSIVDEAVDIKLLRPDGTITIFNIVSGKGNFWSGRATGLFAVCADKPGRKSFNVINSLAWKNIYTAFVPSEMPPYWPVEALKAQAVAARSESVAKLGRHSKEGFDFCQEVHCQAYSGVQQEAELSTRRLMTPGADSNT